MKNINSNPIDTKTADTKTVSINNNPTAPHIGSAPPHRLYLTEAQMPKQWYNIVADMKQKPDPMLHPGTLQPICANELEGIFCKTPSQQEVNTTDKYIDIPEEILQYYKMYRPSPLCRAYELEKALGTPAKIYYKFEGNNTSGSHKLNSAAAQVFYAKQQGLTHLVTETGAGQWGTALAMACAHYGIDLTVYMVKISAEQKPARKSIMQSFGAKVIKSPSDTTEVGRKILLEHPGTGGSLGCAISEAMETSNKTPNCKYALGSVMNHVVLHQSIIGLESKIAMDSLGEYPDIVIGCIGGGSNFGGLIAEYMGEKINKNTATRFIGVEPASCPSVTRGKYAYDFGDTGCTTPLIRMYTLGAGFMPSNSHVGGLRYHGMSPIISKLYHDNYIEAVTAEQNDVFAAAVQFAKCETILPAPESAHAIKVAIDEALKCKETGEAKTILFGLTGTGYFDTYAYEKFLQGDLTDYIPTDADLEVGFKSLVKIPQNQNI